MLERQFKARSNEEDYDLVLRSDRDWSTKKRRILIVLETVPTVSLMSKDLFTKGLVADTITNAVKLSMKMASKFGTHNPAFALVNFNNRKHLNLKGPARVAAEREFAARIHRLVKKMKATDVFISGDCAAEYLIEHQYMPHKRGWVFNKDGVNYCSTLDLDRLIGEDGAMANLLGYWCRHLSHLIIGRHPFSLKHKKTKPVYVGTRERLKLLINKLNSCGPMKVAIDTETKNLSAYSNQIYTIQFAFEDNPDRGWVLPLNHPQTPWSGKELEYAMNGLRKFFTNSEALLVFFNGSFDLKVIRGELDIPIIYNNVWEITAGEHDLDENIALLNKVRSYEKDEVNRKFGGLRAILCTYENDVYFRATGFTKEDRNTTGNVRPDNKDFLMYAATDVTSLLWMQEQQIERAKLIEIDGKPYANAYKRHVIYMLGDQVHQISHLQADGSYLDLKYADYLLSVESPLKAQRKAVEKEFKQLPSVKAVNERLMRKAGIKSNSLFGNRAANWIFKMSSSAHKAALFFDEMGLKPISETKTGQPAVDKGFIAAYTKTVHEVQAYSDWQEVQKVESTFVRGYRKKISFDPDSIKDHFLRASYGFFNVVTGRLNSYDPNLQNIPQRSEVAKHIKRMFISEEGYLLIRYDYSAHEVRIWSAVALDMILAESFRVGQKLRQKLIAAKTDKERQAIFQELKTKGDIHIQNVFRFFGKWVAKSDPLRDAVKAVVFGVLYGKSAKSLGEDIKSNDLKEAKAKLEKLITAKAPKSEINDAKREVRSITAKDYSDFAQSLIDKMFKEFKAGARWTNKMKKLSEERYYSYSPIGRRRNLFAALTKDRQIVARQVRRGSNAPIQGMASEIGTKASRIVMVDFFTNLKYFKTKLKVKHSRHIKFNRIVHDANYFAVPYEYVLPFIHILQYGATYGIAKKLKDELGLTMTIEPEVEIEIAAMDSASRKWDWTLPSLRNLLEQAVDDQIKELGYEMDKEDIMAKIMKPYQSNEMVEFLSHNFPLLGVKDLDKQMMEI